MPLLGARMRADETIFSAWSGVPDALAVEIVAAQGFDAVTLDMQHGGHHEDSVLRCMPAILRAAKHGIVRIPVGRWDMASRALDFGAEAVIAPMINSVEDARRFAAATKYPPLGERSWGPTFALPRLGSVPAAYLGSANTERLAFAMIETREAFAILNDILAVPGIDGIFVGPSDFSLAWTGGAKVDPTLEDMMEAVAAIAARTRAAGKFAAIFLMEPKMAGRYAAMGFRMLAGGSEHRLIALGAEAHLSAAKAALQTGV